MSRVLPSEELETKENIRNNVELETQCNLSSSNEIKSEVVEDMNSDLEDLHHSIDITDESDWESMEQTSNMSLVSPSEELETMESISNNMELETQCNLESNLEDLHHSINIKDESDWKSMEQTSNMPQVLPAEELQTEENIRNNIQLETQFNLEDSYEIKSEEEEDVKFPLEDLHHSIDLKDESDCESVDQTTEAGSSGVNTPPAFFWSAKATRVLIDLYQKYRSMVGCVKMKNFKTMWDIIAKELTEQLATEVSSKNCENRWKVLDRNYKKWVDNQNSTGHGRKYFEFSKEMHSIYGKKKNTHPEITLGSDTHHVCADLTEKRFSEEVLETVTSAEVVPNSNTGESLRNREIKKRKSVLEQIREDNLKYYEKQLHFSREAHKEAMAVVKERNELEREKIKRLLDKKCNVASTTLPTVDSSKGTSASLRTPVSTPFRNIDRIRFNDHLKTKMGACAVSQAELVEQQIQQKRVEYHLKLKHMQEKYDLEMKILEIKKQKLCENNLRSS